jgi:hypothetical protein
MHARAVAESEKLLIHTLIRETFGITKEINMGSPENVATCGPINGL